MTCRKSHSTTGTWAKQVAQGTNDCHLQCCAANAAKPQRQEVMEWAVNHEVDSKVVLNAPATRNHGIDQLGVRKTTTIPEWLPKYEKRSNGAAERAMRTIKGQVGTMVSAFYAHGSANSPRTPCDDMAHALCRRLALQKHGRKRRQDCAMAHPEETIA